MPAAKIAFSRTHTPSDVDIGVPCVLEARGRNVGHKRIGSLGAMLNDVHEDIQRARLVFCWAAEEQAIISENI